MIVAGDPSAGLDGRWRLNRTGRAAATKALRFASSLSEPLSVVESVAFALGGA
jgi:hypothetical protein